MDDMSSKTITFRCPPELEPILPRPVPAVLGLPDWFKTMPQKAFSTVLQTEQMTVKKCPPFIDAMTFGFLIPLIADLRAEDGMLSWDRDVPPGALTNYSRSPIDFHDNNQVTGTPFYEEDRFLIKFANFGQLHRQFHQLPGALARYCLQRRAAERNARCPVRAGQAR